MGLVKTRRLAAVPMLLRVSSGEMRIPNMFRDVGNDLMNLYHSHGESV